MIYGVFSDVHSNYEALSAVLDYLEDLGVGGWICCGDLVGYGPDPDACLDRNRSLKNLSIICGNHDLAVLGRLDVEWFNAYAKAAALWTREVLSADSRAFLESLTARLGRASNRVVGQRIRAGLLPDLSPPPIVRFARSVGGSPRAPRGTAD